jgi:hypothetical protein
MSAMPTERSVGATLTLKGPNFLCSSSVLRLLLLMLVDPRERLLYLTCC